MNFNLISVFVLFWIYNFASGSGVTKCYSCNSPACNDPFNPSNADIMNCSNITNYRSLSNNNGNELDDLNDVIFKKFGTLYEANTEYICVKYFVDSTSIANYNFTVRRCMPKYVNNVAACEVTSQTIGQSGFGRVNSCSICDSDLCNSATRWSSTGLIVTAIFVLFGFLLLPNIS